MGATNFSDSGGRIRSGQEDQEIYERTEAALQTLSSSQFMIELSKTDGLTIEDIITPGSTQVTSFGNWWASPLSSLNSLASGRLYATGGSGANDAGVIDTQLATMRIEPYASPGVSKTHSHLMSLDAATNPQTDFTLGNLNAAGTKYAGSLPNANDTLEVVFNQSQVLLELNSAQFTFNTVIKPIPLVELSPNKVVPLATPFHKVKYIIKAY